MFYLAEIDIVVVIYHCSTYILAVEYIKTFIFMDLQHILS